MTTELIAGGHYARKQIFSRNPLIAWSHASRFRLARRLVAPHAGAKVLDYGSGDGTFLALVHDLFPTALGVDVDPAQVRECAARLAPIGNLRFASTEVLTDPRHTGAYDAVTCMEVLEHCPDDVQKRVLDDLHRVCAPRGSVIISVPVEVGPTLVAKQAVRACAALSGLHEYDGRERYSLGELVTMLFARADTRVPRQESAVTLPDGRTLRFTGHKGFNWRALELLLTSRFAVERRLYSPVPLAGPWLNSQVWFVCTPRTYPSC